MLMSDDGGIGAVPKAKKSRAIPFRRQKFACSMKIIPCSNSQGIARNIMKLRVSLWSSSRDNYQIL
jgi:hypothetical protein